MGLAGSFPSDLIKEALTIKQNTEDFKGFLVIGSKGYFSLKKMREFYLLEQIYTTFQRLIMQNF